MSLQKVKIGSFLKRIKNTITIEDSKNYKRITIRTKHQGISIRDEVKGLNIGTKSQFTVNKGQFLLSKIDARLGAFGIVPSELDNGIITGNFWAYEVDEKKVNIEWFNLFTSSGNFYEICDIASSGTTHRKYLDEKKFLGFEIIVPPITAQNIFIEKFKSQKVGFVKLSSELQHQGDLIKKLRQSILQDAVQGKLVEQNAKDEPAEKLLAKIKAEKQKLISEGKLKKEKELPPISPDEIPFELPKGWAWCRLGEICTKIGSGSTPRGGREVYTNEGIIFLRSQNVYNDGLDLSNVAYIDKETHKKMEGTKVIANDILLNITGGSIGRTTLISKDFDEANVSQHVSIIRLVDKLNNIFIHKILLSPYFQDKIMEVQTGGNREGLAKKNMELMLLPVPPISEQERIVKKVEELMQMCDNLEAEVSTQQEQVKNLMQSVLREAFEGK